MGLGRRSATPLVTGAGGGVGRPDSHPYLDIRPHRGERLEHRAVGACNFRSRAGSFGCAGERRRVGRRASMGPMHGQDAEMGQQEHCRGSNHDDHRIERCQLTVF
jgi:hypothetical protein